MEMLGDLCAVGNAANAQDCRNLFPNYRYSSRIFWPQIFVPQMLKIPSEMEVAPRYKLLTLLTWRTLSTWFTLLT